LGGWKVGKLESWKVGKLEGWKVGKYVLKSNFPTSQPPNLPPFQLPTNYYVCIMFRLSNFLLLFCFIFLISCENDLEKVKLYSKGKNAPQESARNIKILYSDSARVEVELTAPVLNHYITENPYIEMPKGLHAIFYDDKMEVKSSLDADYGIRYEREQKMEAKKNVTVINQKGEKLNTEHLIWDEKQEKLYSKEFVKITTKDEIIYGNGFEANQDFSKYKIFNIKGTISLNNEIHAKDS
jgi:LPS export ABC transporter protein LptC